MSSSCHHHWAYTFTSIVAYTVLANNILFVWSICLAIWETSFPPWSKPSCLLLQGLVSFEPRRLLLYSFIHLFIPPPGFRWFLKRAQTSVAASSRGSFSFDQTVSAKFAVSAVTPALVAAAVDAVVTFNLKDDWNWIAVTGSLSFQVRMRGKNLRFFKPAWSVCNEVTHYHVVLFDALLISNDFYIADCTAETLMIEYVVKLGWMIAGVE